MERPFFKSEYVLKPINAAIGAAISGPVTVDLVCSALDYIGTIHPLLRSTIAVKHENDKIRYAWTPLSPRNKWYTFTSVVRTSSQQVVDIFEESIHEPFTEGGPFTRIFLIQSADKKKAEIIVSVSHVIMDGRSVNVLFDQLLFVMAAKLQGKDLNLPQQASISSPTTDTLDLKQELETFGDFAQLPITSKVPALERKWGVVNRTVPEILQNLRAACRAKGVSVNAAICAAFFVAMDFECKKQSYKNPPSYLVGTVTDVAGGNTSQISSLNITNIVTEIKETNSMNFWDFAQNYEKQVKQKIANRQYDIPFIDENSEITPHNIADSVMFDSQGRVLSFLISNIGDVNKLLGKEHGETAWYHPPFKIDDITCVGSNLEVIGPCFFLCVFIFNGNIHMSVTFPVPTYERPLLKRILDLAINTLQKNSTGAKL